MKRIFILLIAFLMTAGLSARDIHFIGVDFRYVKVFGADETAEEFHKAFRDINDLMVYEAPKYDFSRVLKEKVITSIEPTLPLNRDMNCSTIFTYASEVPELPVQEIVKSYDLGNLEGLALVVIPHFYNKSQEKGSNYVVIFDIATREVLRSDLYARPAAGMGLRNYWAKTIYRIVKSERIRLD